MPNINPQKIKIAIETQEHKDFLLASDVYVRFEKGTEEICIKSTHDSDNEFWIQSIEEAKKLHDILEIIIADSEKGE